MPTPQSDENHDEFIDRCMEDDEANEDFPDPNQRLAFCESVWDQSQENSMSDRERRVAGDIDVETRADGEGKRLIGHAAVFDSRSLDLGGFTEIIERGAFQKSLGEDADIRALWNHDDSVILGRTRSGTLTLREDDVGLRVEIDPPETRTAQDLMVSVERGDVNQMSFAFRVRQGGQSFDEEEDGSITRRLSDVELFEVSPVTFPAYPETSVDFRAFRQWQEQRQGQWSRRARMRKAWLDRTRLR